MPGSSGSKRPPRVIPKKKDEKENYPGIDDDDAMESKHREHQVLLYSGDPKSGCVRISNGRKLWTIVS